MTPIFSEIALPDVAVSCIVPSKDRAGADDSSESRKSGKDLTRILFLNLKNGFRSSLPQRESRPD
jgi:hypothetical protein